MSDQAYYWTPEWQADEAASRHELERGEGRTFATAEEAIAWLELDDEVDDTSPVTPTWPTRAQLEEVNRYIELTSRIKVVHIPTEDT